MEYRENLKHKINKGNGSARYKNERMGEFSPIICRKFTNDTVKQTANRYTLYKNVI